MSQLLTNGGQDESTLAIEQTSKEFNQLFSTRNPKDAVAGLSSGLKSIGKGVVGGVASLLAMPIVGAQNEVFMLLNKRALWGSLRVLGWEFYLLLHLQLPE
jgi:hypothetical protein